MDSVMEVGRVLVSLAAVLGVMWVIARRVRKSGGAGKGTRVIEVLDRSALTKSASVAVVRVGDRALVLGVADAQVSVLGETDLAAAKQAQAEAGTGKRGRGATHRTMRPPVAAPAPASAPPSPPASAPASAPALAGSALSPQTWRQTIESLRDLTSRT